MAGLREGGNEPPGSLKASNSMNGRIVQVQRSARPYRTTPLVLPGAKVKKDAAPTSSYLRHHPNPMFRAPPSHYDPTAEVLMKQKVADTVLQRVAGEEAAASKQVMHKQFNSPIGLYSDQNIAETIQQQTGITPLRKTLSYDPAKSETFKALQEAELGDNIQEVTVPVQTRVFSPSAQLKHPAPKHTSTKLHLDPFTIRIQLAKLKNLFTKVEASGA
ncbi:hypothetical protein ANN_14984 [Periplaneta americana]|uniref:Zasp-like motif domain-containing protein n=1 Tax=Periplaneta americana TaxID=6978 RepID=A0ABQ8SYF6_PERAM|nr:hypothetical protein ANN_14984 [Periplaneta americana]